MEEIKLYNMDEQEWKKGNFNNRGDRWRSDAIYQCKVCHTKTNEWVMGGYLGTGPKILCPGDLYQEHEELESALEKYLSLVDQIQEFKGILQDAPNTNQERANSMIDNLHAQKELFDIKIGNLRKIFSGKLDDVKGLDASSRLIEYTTSSKTFIRGKKKSLADLVD